MILQGSLRIEYMGLFYTLNVKTIFRNRIYYFYVTEKDDATTLLGGETIELNYSDSFCIAEQNEKMTQQKVAPDIITAVEKLLLDNKELWYY